jgi:hypothetical protein
MVSFARISADRPPERRFHEEDVGAGRSDGPENIAEPDARANGVACVAILLPDDKHGAARPPFPAEDDITLERADIEVAIIEGKRRIGSPYDPIPVRLDLERRVAIL